MNQRLTVALGLAASLLIFLSGCGNDNNPLNGGCNGLTWAEAYENEFQDVSDTATAFSEEQTVASCNAYKSALQDWYDALSSISSSCLFAISEAEYKESLAEAQESIDEIDCSEFADNNE